MRIMDLMRHEDVFDPILLTVNIAYQVFVIFRPGAACDNNTVLLPEHIQVFYCFYFSCYGADPVKTRIPCNGNISEADTAQQLKGGVVLEKNMFETSKHGSEQ